ncbi:MAG: hypothetical protein AAF829_00460 [Pseudomonadota bacterium]
MSDIGMILDRIGRTLVTEVGPALDGHYASGKASLSGLIAVMAGEAWNGAADKLSREINGMKALLANGGDSGAADILPESLKLNDLRMARNELAERLIALQVALEADDTDDAITLNRQIWGFLLATASERLPSPPKFPDAEA